MIWVKGNCYYNILKNGEVIFSTGKYDDLISRVKIIRNSIDDRIKRNITVDDYEIGVFNYILMQYEYLYDIRDAEQYIIDIVNNSDYVIDEEQINKTYEIKKQGIRCNGCKLIENNIFNYDCRSCPLLLK